jgi:hypothetical protein
VHPHVDLISALKVGKEARAIDQAWVSPASLGWVCWKRKKWQGKRRHWEVHKGSGDGEPAGPNGDRVRRRK